MLRSRLTSEYICTLPLNCNAGQPICFVMYILFVMFLPHVHFAQTCFDFAIVRNVGKQARKYVDQ